MHDYKDNFQNAIDFAIKKVGLTWWKLILLGVMGCVYVGLGYICFIMVIAGMQDQTVFAKGWEELVATGVQLPGLNMSGFPLVVAAALFPVGLLLIIFLGGSLFTSDNLTSIAIMTKQIKIPPVVLKWALTLLGNILGAFIIAAIVRGGHIFTDRHLYVLQQIIAKKVHMEWWNTIFSGVLCNILVAGTVWATMATKHSIAKIFLIYFPIWLFAVVGFQHVTANSILFAFGWVHADNPLMQNIGQGIFTDGTIGSIANTLTLSDWSFRVIFINMIPAMIGNWFSGAIFLPFVYFWLSGQHHKMKEQKKRDKETKTLDLSGVVITDFNNDEDSNILTENEQPDFNEFYDVSEEDLYPADSLINKIKTDE